jgi:hypothetical protein
VAVKDGAVPVSWKPISYLQQWTRSATLVPSLGDKGIASGPNVQAKVGSKYFSSCD